MKHQIEAQGTKKLRQGKELIQRSNYLRDSMGICSESAAKNYVLIVATLTSFLPPFMASSINIALPAIGAEFSMDAVLLGWIATSYLLSAAVFMVPFGKFSDIYGMKKIFILGLIIFTVSSLLAMLAPNSSTLIATRVLQGIGSAMIFGTGTAILVNVFPLRDRGKVLGINAASVYLGLSLGPFIGGFLTEFFGWRSLFLVNVVLGLVPLALALWKMQGEWAEARGERFDLTGSVIYSMMLVLTMYGFSLLPSPSGLALILAGTAALFLLVKWESRVEYPVLDVELFRKNRVYAFSNLAALINYSATYAVTFLLSLYLQYNKGLSPDQAGSILMAQPLVMTVLSPYAGRLSDRIEPRLVASAGMAITFLAVLTLAFLQQTTSILYVIASLSILGFGLSLFTSPNTNAIMSSIDRTHYGVGSATLGTMRLVGQVTSMAVAMLVFSAFLGNEVITPESYPQLLSSIQAAFMIFAAFCLLGIFASLARGTLR